MEQYEGNSGWNMNLTTAALSLPYVIFGFLGGSHHLAWLVIALLWHFAAGLLIGMMYSDDDDG